MSLPILFTAGMCLFDTLDGLFMRRAYGWAFERPVRKVYYNLVVTALSVLVALVIGSVILVAFVAEHTAARNGPMGAISRVNLDVAGFAIVGLFAGTWLLSIVCWKYLRIEERWSLRPSVT